MLNRVSSDHANSAAGTICVRVISFDGRSGLIPLQSHQAASIALVGSGIGPGSRNLRQALLFPQPPARLRARGGLEIVRLRFRGGTATLGKAENLELRDDALQRQAQAVADAHPMSRFHPVGVQVNFAAGDRGGGQASRLVKPAMPQPFVQSMNIGFVHARYNSGMSAL